MRKIAKIFELDEITFDSKYVYKMLDLDGSIITLATEPSKEHNNYTAEQKLEIIRVNEMLKEKDKLPLTESEIEWMFKGSPKTDITEVEQLQKLAGFAVEKKITYVK